MLTLPAAKESGPSSEVVSPVSLEEVTGPSLKGVDPLIMTRAQTLTSVDPSALSRSEAAQILGIGEDADVKAVKSGYRAVARNFHPDAHPEASPVEREVLEAASKVVNGAKDALLSEPKAPRTTSPAEYHHSSSQERSEARATSDEEYHRPQPSQERYAAGPASERRYSMEQELRAQRFDSLLSYYFAATVGASSGEHLSRKIEHELAKPGSAESLTQRILDSFDHYLGREILGVDRRALSPAGQEAAFRKLESSIERLGKEDLAASILVADRLVKAGVISKEDGAHLVKELIGDEVRSLLDTKGRDEKHLVSLLEKIAPALEKSAIAGGVVNEFLEDSLAKDGAKRGASMLQTARDSYLISAALGLYTRQEDRSSRRDES